MKFDDGPLNVKLNCFLVHGSVKIWQRAHHSLFLEHQSLSIHFLSIYTVIHGLNKNNGCHNYLYKRDAPRLHVSSQCQESTTCKYMVSVIGYARQNMQNNEGMFVGNNQHFARRECGRNGILCRNYVLYAYIIFLIYISPHDDLCLQLHPPPRKRPRMVVNSGPSDFGTSYTGPGEFGI